MQWIMQHKLMFIIVIVLLALGVWYGLSQSGTPAPLLTSSTPSGSPSTDAANQQLVSTLLTLRAVTLNGTIFTDPAFLSLQDFSTNIVPEPVGRSNPFAPLASSTVVLPENPHAAQLFAPKTP
jgi:hypothetical protein